MILYIAETTGKAGQRDTRSLLPEAFSDYRGRYGLSENAPLAWSVSHTGAYWLGLVSHECDRVGVDAEMPVERPFEALSARYFSEDEQTYVRREGPMGFYRIWTAKECLVKFFRAQLYSTLSGTSLSDGDSMKECWNGAWFRLMETGTDMICTICADRKDILTDCRTETL